MKNIFLWIAVFLSIFVTNSFADTHKVVDSLGRTVEIPTDPKRIVSLIPSATEIIYELGEGKRLKGVSTFSDYPAEAKKLPKVGSFIQLDIEKIIALKPDLCIGIGTKDKQIQKGAEILEQFGIPFLAIHASDLETIIKSVSIAGKALNASAKAEKIVIDMRSRINKVKATVAKAKNKPGVFIQIGISPIVSAGSNTFIDQLIKVSGGVNLAGGASFYPRFSREQVISLAPDIIIITSMARRAIFEKVKRDWEKWPFIPAVKSDKVIIAPSNLFDRPTPRLVKGLEQMARYIHPELFGDKL